MSWMAIADVIGVDLAELVQAVERRTGKPIPRELWGASPAARESVAPPCDIGGFLVTLDAPPPPKKLGDGRMALLAQKLRPGARIESIEYKEFLSLRKYLSHRGWGSEFRWLDRDAGTVRAWVLADLAPRQRSQKERAAAKKGGARK